MLEKSFGLLFFLKQTRNQQQREKFIYLKITVDGKANELSTKRRCVQASWNPAFGRATGKRDYPRIEPLP